MSGFAEHVAVATGDPIRYRPVLACSGARGPRRSDQPATVVALLAADVAILDESLAAEAGSQASGAPEPLDVALVGSRRIPISILA
jgi:hypothetical protein